MDEEIALALPANAASCLTRISEGGNLVMDIFLPVAISITCK